MNKLANVAKIQQKHLLRRLLISVSTVIIQGKYHVDLFYVIFPPFKACK